MTKEYIEKWFSSSMEERRKHVNVLEQLQAEYPYFQLGSWMAALIQEEAYESWFCLQTLDHLHPVSYAVTLNNAQLIKEGPSLDWVEEEAELVSEGTVDVEGNTEEIVIVEEPIEEVVNDEEETEEEKTVEKESTEEEIVVEETELAEEEILVDETKEEEVDEEVAIEEKVENTTIDIKRLKDEVVKVSGDFFHKEREEMPDALEEIAESFKGETDPVDDDQSLMVVMSFSEWLNYLHEQSLKSAAEEESKRALRAMWQREKLGFDVDEEKETEIPEQVFEMAYKSISNHEEIVSEPMAIVHEKQGRWEEAKEIYNKLILRNPEKSSYFADKIKEIEKKQII